MSSGSVRYATSAGRAVIAATVLGSGMASLDATVVNVALPTIGRDLDATVAGLQWVVTGYLLTLASLVLAGGSLGDRLGRRRVFVVGVVWFAASSALCGAAPDLTVLVGARLLQGVGGALLVPGSLAIIEAVFDQADRQRAIGAWTALGGVATAIGPFAGGWLVSAATWRLVFLLNIPLAVATLALARHIPESKDPQGGRAFDVPGAILAVVCLGAFTGALLNATDRPTLLAVLLGVAVGSGGAFGAVERRSHDPMLPLDVFASAQFSAANAVTFVVYAALGGGLFLLAIDLQQAAGYSPLAAGAALIPITVVMLALSARFGALAQRIGPRLPMSVGPAVVAVGLLAMVRITTTGDYLTQVLPAVLVFSLGLAVTVAPLTATVLAAAPERLAGVASGVNNAVARAAGLIAVAVLPVAAGITGTVNRHPAALTADFHRAVVVAAATCAAGAVLAAATIRNPTRAAGAQPRGVRFSCPVDAPPLRHVAD